MEPKQSNQAGTSSGKDERIQTLAKEAQRRAPLDVARILLAESDETVGEVLQQLHQAPAYRILLRFPKDRREAVVKFAGNHMGDPWKDTQKYSENSVGRLMEPP